MKTSMKEWKADLKIGYYFYRKIIKISKFFIFCTLLIAIIETIISMIAIITPKLIIDEICGENRKIVFFCIIGIALLIELILGLNNKYLHYKLEIMNTRIINELELQLCKHILKLKYEDLEDPKMLEFKEEALFTVRTQNSIDKLISSFVEITKFVFIIVGSISVISTLDIKVILIIILFVFINSKIVKKIQSMQFHMFKRLIPINRKFIYYNSFVTDFMIAKDIRIYDMEHKISNEIKNCNKSMLSEVSSIYKRTGRLQGISGINIQLENILIYIYLIYKVYTKSITVASFVMYIAAVEKLFSSLKGIVDNSIMFRQMCKYLTRYKEFEDIRIEDSGDYMNKNKFEIPKDFTIEFRNVSFQYPRTNEYTIKNISLSFKKGEKLAVVGENGAGKTTFIKLLCRLYKPNEGVILFNGVDINTYEYNDYIKLLGVIFQDFKLFSTTVKENIAGYQNEDRDGIIDALKKTGIYDTIFSCENNIERQVYKIFDNDGIVLSGGQSQKLAIARAIYRDSPLIIMDEPTSALDPYAEMEVYKCINENVDGKTIIFISHRLSSCCFCDKIIVFDGGKIIECGNHNELMNLDGKYAEMFKAQAKYYQQ